MMPQLMQVHGRGSYMYMVQPPPVHQEYRRVWCAENCEPHDKQRLVDGDE